MKLKGISEIRNALFPEVSLEEPADGEQVLADRRAPMLFLRRYSEDDIREAFVRWGIDAALGAQGLAGYGIRLDTSDPDRQALVIEAQTGQVIAELLTAIKPYPQALLFDWYSGRGFRRPAQFEMLVVTWVKMQHPHRGFAPGSLPLPGQEHPGLGLGHKVMGLLHAAAKELSLDGLINRPEFLHNAFMYIPQFRFADPAVQGKLDALLRDLAPIPMAELAWAQHCGAIHDQTGATSFDWFKANQVLPLSEALTDILHGRKYEAVRTAARKAARFTLDQELLARTLRSLSKS